MDAMLIVSVNDIDHLTQVLKAVYARADVLTLNIYPYGTATNQVSFTPPPRPPEYELSPIEWAMIEQAVQGVTRRQIAIRLSLTPSSISTYWTRIYSKLHVNSRADLVTWYHTEIAKIAVNQSEEASSQAIFEDDSTED